MSVDQRLPPTCYLDIEGVPASVGDGVPFSFVVRVEDAAGGGGALVTGDCASTSDITVYDGVEGPVLTGGPVRAIAGVATFNNVTVSGAGSHTLYAYATPLDCSTFVVYDSQQFQVTTGTVCPPTQICTSPTITSPDGTTATITAGPGSTITASFSTLAQANFTACPTYAPTHPNSVLTFNVTHSRLPKLLKLVENVVAGPIRVCWNAPTRFRQRGGTPSSADPKGGFTGLLPDCLTWNPTLPCVSPRSPRTGSQPFWSWRRPAIRSCTRRPRHQDATGIGLAINPGERRRPTRCRPSARTG